MSGFGSALNRENISSKLPRGSRSFNPRFDRPLPEMPPPAPAGALGLYQTRNSTDEEQDMRGRVSKHGGLEIVADK